MSPHFSGNFLDSFPFTILYFFKISIWGISSAIPLTLFLGFYFLYFFWPEFHFSQVLQSISGVSSSQCHSLSNYSNIISYVALSVW